MVATISADGFASTVGVGTTNITASLDGVTDTAPLEVTSKVAVALQILPPFITDPAGTLGPITAVAIFTDGTAEIVTTAATWNSTNPSVATISDVSSGQLLRYSLEQEGSAEFVAQYAGLEDRIPVNVLAAELLFVEVSPSGETTPVGVEAEYIATGFYSNGDTATLTDEAIWSSSDPGVASIAGQGVSLGVSVGTAQISATHEGITGDAAHTVTGAEIVEILIDPPSLTDPAGTTQEFVARARYTDGTEQNISEEATWASTDTAVAEVIDSEAPALRIACV